MGEVRTIAKNMVVLTASRAVGMFLSFALLILVARHYGAELFGEYNFALAFSIFFVIVSDFGLTTIAIRDVARCKSDKKKYLTNIFALKLGLTFLVALTVFFVVLFLGYPSHLTSIICIIVAASLVESFSNTFRLYFKAFQRMEFEALLVFLQSLFFFVLGWTVVTNSLDIVFLALAYLLVNVFILFLSAFLALKKITSFSWRLDPALLKYLLVSSAPLMLIGFLEAVYTRIDAVLLSKLTFEPIKAIGLYSSVYRLIDALTVLQVSFFIAIFPVLSEFFHSNRQRFEFLYTRSFKLIIIFSFPLASLISVFSLQIVQIIYGREFIEAASALTVLAWVLPFTFLNSLLFNVLYSSEKQKWAMVFFALTAGLNILLNLLLIPVMSFVGASVSALMSSAFLFALLFFYVSRKTAKPAIMRYLPKLSVLNMLFFALVFLFNESFGLTFFSFILILFVSILYLFLLFVLRVVDEKDLGLLRQLTGRR